MTKEKKLLEFESALTNAMEEGDFFFLYQKGLDPVFCLRPGIDKENQDAYVITNMALCFYGFKTAAKNNPELLEPFLKMGMDEMNLGRQQ